MKNLQNCRGRMTMKSERFVYMGAFEDNTAQASVEIQKAVTSIDTDLESKSPDEAIKIAKTKIDAVGQKNLAFINDPKNTEILRDAGGKAITDYKRGIDKLVSDAYAKIDAAKETYALRKQAIETWTKYQAESADLHSKYVSVETKASVPSAFVEIRDTDVVADKVADIGAARASLNSLAATNSEAKALLARMNEVSLDLAKALPHAPGKIIAEMAMAEARIAGGIVKLQPMVDKTAEGYDAGLKQLQKELPARIPKERDKITQYQNESGTLQQKSKTPGAVEGTALADAYKKYTDQQAFVPQLEAFAAEMAAKKPMGGGSAGGGAPAVA